MVDNKNGEYELKLGNTIIKYNRVEDFLHLIFLNSVWNIFENSEQLKKEVRDLAFVEYSYYCDYKISFTDYYDYLRECILNYLVEKINNNEINRKKIINEELKNNYSIFNDEEMKYILLDAAFGMAGYIVNYNNVDKHMQKLNDILKKSGMSEKEILEIRKCIQGKIDDRLSKQLERKETTLTLENNI